MKNTVEFPAPTESEAVGVFEDRGGAAPPSDLCVERPWSTTRFAEALGKDVRTFSRMYHTNRQHFPKPLNPNSRYLLWPAAAARHFVIQGNN